MGFLRVAGTAMVLLSGMLFGMSLNRGLREELARGEAYGRLVRWVRLQVSCFALPIGDILRRADPALLYACGWRREGTPEDLSDLLSAGAPTDGELSRLLFELSAEFGREYRQEQVARCDYYLKEIETRTEGMRARMDGKRRVNLTLCSAGAAALVILFI